MFDPKPLAGPPLRVYPAGDTAVGCADCKEIDWVWRPDGSRICGHCLLHRGVIAPNTNGEVTWCRICVSAYWAERDRVLALLQARRQ